MPLGPIHLIKEETEMGSGAIYFCDIDDAIAAISPARLAGFPRDAMCDKCMEAYEQSQRSSVRGAD